MKGKIIKVSGPTVHTDLQGLKLYERVLVKGITGEAVRLLKNGAVIQVYEETSGLGIGDEVESLGQPLSVKLGPGMLSAMYDGLQRPLTTIAEESGAFIKRTEKTAYDVMKTKSEIIFYPIKKKGDTVKPGEIMGHAKENDYSFEIRNNSKNTSKITEISEKIIKENEPIAVLENGFSIMPHETLPVRTPRPVVEKLPAKEPLITGQRIVDFLFPLVKGGAAIIPGGFGTGKTILEQTIAKYADVDIVVYAGCGERGNEMAQLIEEFMSLKDPRTGESLMKRTVLVVNTSNMPVAAREASIYTAVTIAEYYRDNGLDVLLLADSISRWAEALREISTSLEEMPGEEGYPTYLASRLSAFLERAGAVKTASGKKGSLSMIISVSPPGGDFTEPVTQTLLRNTGVFLMLDTSLAHRRHFPAINWFHSYSLYSKIISEKFISEISPKWPVLKQRCVEILQREESLLEVAEIVGKAGMQENDKILLQSAERIRNEFLAQNAYSEDALCRPHKTIEIIEKILNDYDLKIKEAAVLQ
ncbi:MAG: V-type ATP synthase subunit A [Spirochaetia bacterium]|nr:V-type ATP synthase subunit A [Spirochaetia bacterium]